MFQIFQIYIHHYRCSYEHFLRFQIVFLGQVFVNQPAVKLFSLNKNNEKFQVAQKVQDLGFLIGLHTNKISKKKLQLIHDTFFKIDSL